MVISATMPPLTIELIVTPLNVKRWCSLPSSARAGAKELGTHFGCALAEPHLPHTRLPPKSHLAVLLGSIG